VRLVRRLLSHNRIRQARKRLMVEQSPTAYAGLAREHAWDGQAEEALRVCNEGLEAFPGNPELHRLAERTQRAQREDRIHELKAQLRDSPRPAVYMEMCQELLKLDQVVRAEECAQEWSSKCHSPEAKLMLAKVCVARFLTDRGRDAGKRAFELLNACQDELGRDARPWKLRMKLASAIGAWTEARQAASQLLELNPGDPYLEGKFRKLNTLGEKSPSIEQALRQVERTGKLLTDDPQKVQEETSKHDVRPALQSLAAESGVHAVVYLRGSTGLVQGPRGATAERAARAMRGIVKTGRSAARRLGLGQVSSITLEGNFGSIALVSGETDAGAIWCEGKLPRSQEEALMNLAGVDAATEGAQS
jgi:tetratricopeptide (TPR) repeat protein